VKCVTAASTRLHRLWQAVCIPSMAPRAMGRWRVVCAWCGVCGVCAQAVVCQLVRCVWCAVATAAGWREAESGDPTEVRRGRPRRVPPRDPGVRFSWSLNLNSRLDDDLTLSRSFERRALGCNRHAHVRMWRGG
jgi:hypothetical protein